MREHWAVIVYTWHEDCESVVIWQLLVIKAFEEGFFLIYWQLNMMNTMVIVFLLLICTPTTVITSEGLWTVISDLA